MGQGKDALRTVKQGLVALRQMAGNKIYEAPTTHGKKGTVRCCLFSGAAVKSVTIFVVFFWKRRCQKVTEVVVLKVFHMFILREYFWLSFFCSKSSEWTTTLIDTISIHNHGTPRCNDFHVNISLVGAKISFSRTSSLNFVRHFENSMRYHCFIPWWAPVSWDMTLMKPCVCAPRKLERSFLGWEDLQFGSLYFTTGPCWVFWVGDEFSFCKCEW